MKTIIKKNAPKANSIIDPYLTWAQTENWYPPKHLEKLYTELRNPRCNGQNNRHELIDNVLLPEQENRCCYCMRHIENHNDSASIEHIIPQSTCTQHELQHYFTPNSDGLNATNVCLTSIYINNGSHTPPYPHHVAYHNFAIACIQCNSERRHRIIEPIFLYEGIESEITYNKKTGEIEWPNDPEYSKDPIFMPALPTVELIGLNRPELKAIRAVWFCAKRNNTFPPTLDINQRAELIYTAFSDSLDDSMDFNQDDFNAYNNLFREEIWELLLKYDYFWTIE